MTNLSSVKHGSKNQFIQKFSDLAEADNLILFKLYFVCVMLNPKGTLFALLHNYNTKKVFSLHPTAYPVFACNATSHIIRYNKFTTFT